MSRMIDGDVLIDRMKELHELVERDYEETDNRITAAVHSGGLAMLEVAMFMVRTQPTEE